LIDGGEQLLRWLPPSAALPRNPAWRGRPFLICTELLAVVGWGSQKAQRFCSSLG
jgi:hypothetical protein